MSEHDLDGVWAKLGYAKKSNAIRAMQRRGIDHHTGTSTSERAGPGQPSTRILMSKAGFQQLSRDAPRPFDVQIREQMVVTAPAAVVQRPPGEQEDILAELKQLTAVIDNTSVRDAAIAQAQTAEAVALAHTEHHRRIWPYLRQRDGVVDRARALGGVNTEVQSFLSSISFLPNT